MRVLASDEERKGPLVSMELVPIRTLDVLADEIRGELGAAEEDWQSTVRHANPRRRAAD
jgi:hypothetical protein